MEFVDFIRKCEDKDIKFKIVDTESNITLLDNVSRSEALKFAEESTRQGILSWRIENGCLAIYICT